MPKYDPKVALSVSYITGLGRAISTILAFQNTIKPHISTDDFSYLERQIYFALKVLIAFSYSLAEKEMVLQHILGTAPCLNNGADHCSDGAAQDDQGADAGSDSAVQDDQGAPSNGDNQGADAGGDSAVQDDQGAPSNGIKGLINFAVMCFEFSMNSVAAACDAGTTFSAMQQMVLTDAQSRDQASYTVLDILMSFICLIIAFGRFYVYAGHKLFPEDEHRHGHRHEHEHEHEHGCGHGHSSPGIQYYTLRSMKILVGVIAGVSHGSESYFAATEAAKPFDLPARDVVLFAMTMLALMAIKAALVETGHFKNIHCPNRHDIFPLFVSALYTLPALATIAQLPLPPEKKGYCQLFMAAIDTPAGWVSHGEYGRKAAKKFSEGAKKCLGKFNHDNPPIKKASAEAPLMGP